MRSQKLVIFDCDGTLVDSEAFNARCFVEALTHQGLHVDFEDYAREFIGHQNGYIVKTLSERHGVALDREKVVSLYGDLALERMEHGIRVLPESQDVVRRLSARYTMAVGSNSERRLVLAKVAAGYGDLFDVAHIFTSELVKHPKPAPDLFLHAANAMGYDAANAVVIEDTVSGVRAGLAAGMETIGYTGLAEDPEEAEKALRGEGVTKVINSLGDLERHL